ncbi:MAG TPA: dTDP-4-dehydrorhamnose 3,5-epimerase family protein [Acidobacteriota bacterium]|nr:dTDP-4-dehydrorhamnose 3,5-epimerase family protein [Acidobacteriota bacterium]
MDINSNVADAEFESAKIEGVVIKYLKTFHDERGFFREIIRVNDSFFEEGFGQWSHAVMHTGTAKAWHVHREQVDWWYVFGGVLKVALFDRRKGSSTEGKMMRFLMGDEQRAVCVKIPPGVAHGCRCLSGPANLFYVTSNVYNPDDEGRIRHDDPDIGYDWESWPEIT